MFYAHTISPIAIAILTSLVMVIFIGAQYPVAGVIATIAMMGSFGPVVALSNRSNNLSQTLASGERVLSLLEEEPQITEVSGEATTEFEGAAARQVSFAYENEQILKDYSVEFPKGKIIGIHGASSYGKSTLLKLLMRFWDVDGGSVSLSGKNVKKINTTDLRNMESYVTQETYLFHDSIANNIAVGKPGASRAEIIVAAKKASIHITKALVNAVKGDLDHGLIFCGANVGRIKQMMSVHDLMQELQPEG